MEQKEIADKDQIVVPKQLAAMIGYNVDTIYDWINQSGMPAYRKGNRGHIGIRMSEFWEWWRNKPDGRTHD